MNIKTPSTFEQRQTIAAKLSDMRDHGTAQDHPARTWARRELARLDALLVQEEMDRLRASKKYRFHGTTLEQQLGVDAWILAPLTDPKREE